MPTADLTRRVSELLKKYYSSTSPDELKSFKLRKHSKSIAEFIEDPLLWVRLCYPTGQDERSVVKSFAPLKQIDKHLFRDSTDIVTRRLKELEDRVLKIELNRPNLTELVSYERFFTKILEAQAVQKGISLPVPVDCPVSTQCGTSLIPAGTKPQRVQGVVVDLFAESGVGYVCSGSSHGFFEEYEFNYATVVSPGESSVDLLPLHIGDVVSFHDSASNNRVSSLSVTQYLPGVLQETFIERYLTKRKPEHPVSSSPAWIAMLNEARFYRKPKFFHQVLVIAESAIQSCLGDSNSTCAQNECVVRNMTTLSRSSFLKDMVFQIEQDSRQKNPSDSPEFQEYAEDVHAAVRLLAALVQQFPEKAFQLAASAKHAAELPEPLVGQEVKHLASTLIKAFDSSAKSTSTHIELPTTPNDATGVIVPTTGVYDPLFWLRKLPYITNPLPENLQPFSQVQIGEHEKFASFRKEALSKHTLVSEGEKDLTGPEQFCPLPPTSVNVEGTSEGSIQGDESWGPTRQGVITDIYPCTHPESASGWEGYILSPSTTASLSGLESYAFTAGIVAKAHCSNATIPLHIGDLVSFKVSNQDWKVVANCTLKVEQYFPGVLSEDDARDYLITLNLQGADVNVLQRLAKSPAAWKAIINDPDLYPKFFDEIISAFTSSKGASPSAMLQFVRTFQGSSFLRNIPRVLNQTSNTAEYRASSSSQSVTSTTTELLAYLLKNCNFQLQERKAIASMLDQWLERLSHHDDIQCLTLALIECCLVPPSSLKIHDPELPWNSIPTILTMAELESAHQELKQGGKSNGRLAELPKVKERGSYDSLDEYGRTYFTLLREDCYGELIDTVAKVKSVKSPKCDDSSNVADPVYYEATFIGLGRGKGQRIVFCFSFETPPLAIAPATEGKSLLKEDNLVGLSLEGRFENDIIWATVDHTSGVSTFAADQNESNTSMYIRKADVFLQLCSESNSEPDEKIMEKLCCSGNVVAVESPAYFKAYQPVLDALKKIDMGRMHFKDDLLDPSSKVKSAPVILSDDSTVNPSAVYLDESSLPLMKVGDLREDLQKESPTREFQLDPSQKDAVLTALTQPLTLIQGPPGTGKTYVGLKLLELFLSLDTLPKEKPVLVMAYKNRALDHIIDQCENFCPLESIVRIGHTSDGYDHLNEALLSARVKEEMKGSTTRHQQAIDTLYRKVQMASEELTDPNAPLSVKNFLPSMTPEWLVSLLRGAGGVLSTLTPELNRRVNTAPDECLDLLKRKSVMGSQDRKEKRELEKALGEAWDAWTRDIPKTTSPANAVRRKSTYTCSTFQSDEEEQQDYEEVARERRMAADDFDNTRDDATQCDIRLSRPPLGIQVEDFSEVVDHSKVWEQTTAERRQLIHSVLLKRYHETTDNLKEALHEYNEALQHQEWEKEALCLKVLRKARVVGMTTTGAAIHQQLLNRLEAPVVFVEEAAEVLESNLLACLTPHVKHLVLIGDHKQLKPTVSCRRLKANNKFNVSMFERLVNNNFPCVILMTQSRMHPDLVNLFSYHYAAQKKQAGSGLLSNEKLVEHLQHPSCMSTSSYWWSYSEQKEMRVGTGIVNQHEVKMVISLCLWLLTHRHSDLGETSDYTVSILTPYRAQLKKIKKELAVKANEIHRDFPDGVLEKLSGIQVYTVDEFQGHESEIVILSLVRSNRRAQIGFLREKNRLVVGTSRQKRALYIVGDADFLRESSPVLWKEFVTRLVEMGRVGPSLPVVYDSKVYECSDPEQLEKAAKEPNILRFQSNLGEETVQRQHSSPAALGLTASRDTEEIPETQFRKLVLKLQKTTGVAKNRKPIARRLGVSDADIDKVEASESDIEEAFYQMMQKWRQTKGKLSTYRALETALREAGQVSAAETVQKTRLSEMT